ncbi:hypothetical protein [Psychrobacillus psychrodurans]|uniref:hypothetical protein n=1 Tax=Psychrobacillus psychrodurans TaxID=126157 RepID=UPI0008ED824B|nr:hypothetical protein [Psychrobacillus psychrodurans]MCZ8541983.1 hypothetical protein [Psychrobacillus psychrodurans]SFN13745.1 hypothetical protein SAMN05421832_11634 [Psychrobacillus psychrodurans]
MKKQTPSHRNDLSLGESKRTDRPIRFIAKKNIYWDDWGHMRLVFSNGKGYSGILHSDGKITAESPYYGVSDYVDESEIEILN